MNSHPPPRWWCAAALFAGGLFGGCSDPPKDSPSDGPAELGPAPAVSPDTPRLRRLTQVQYRNALSDLFGRDLVLPVSLEPDVREEGFQSVGASSTSISPRGVEQYEDAAYDVAEQVVGWTDRMSEWMDCSVDDFVTEACAEQLVATLGRRAWRRPLTSDEVSTIAGLIFGIEAESGDPATGVMYGIAAILMDSRFLYRAELGTDDGAGGRALTDLELASRLSFLIWNTIPDEALLQLGEAGTLSEPDVLRSEVERMLADPQAREGLRNFFTELYKLDLLDDLSKDPLVIPQASPEVAPAARAETLAVLEQIVFDDDADFRTALTTRETYIDRRLAAIYGVTAPSVDGAGWTELPRSLGRRGVLGHTSFLMLNAHNSTSSATLRGKFVRERLLCQIMPPPPADVDTSIPEPDSTSPTLRDRVQVHLEDPACSGCHELMDPIGLGFENFDAIGRWRDTEAGATIDASGDLDGVGFSDAWEMSAAVSKHASFGPCVAQNLYQYATGLPLGDGEVALVDWLADAFEADGYRVQDLVFRIVESPGFQQVGDIQ